MLKFQALSVALAALVLSATVQAATYTAANAPDMETAQVLAHPITHVQEGAAPGGQWDDAVHRNFPQIIEQNVARLDSRGATALVNNLSDRELSDLATFYTKAVADAGRTPHLLNLFATRLDTTRLARLAVHFGYSDVYTAVSRLAPAKLVNFQQQVFQQQAAMAVRQGASRLPPALPSSGATMMASVGQYLNYTPGEIYLDFRTAPVGALDVAGALYETGALMVQAGAASFAGGYTAGTGIAWVIQTYAPSTWDAIGGTVSNMVDNFNTSLSLSQQGQWQEAFGNLFGMPASQSEPQYDYGGDFDVSSPWETFEGGGGGGCSRDGCWPVEQY